MTHLLVEKCCHSRFECNWSSQIVFFQFLSWTFIIYFFLCFWSNGVNMLNLQVGLGSHVVPTLTRPIDELHHVVPMVSRGVLLCTMK